MIYKYFNIGVDKHPELWYTKGMIRNNTTTKGNEMSTTKLWPNATLGKYKHIWKDDRGVERLAVCMEKYGVRHCKVRFVGHRGKEIYATGIVTVWTDRLVEF